MTNPAQAVVITPGRAVTGRPTADIIAQAAQLVSVIPLGGEDASWSIVDQIMHAQSPADMEKIWSSGSFSDWLGRSIIVTDIHRGESDFKDGLGFFLILSCVDADTGEEFTVTTGSLNVVVQLAWAYTNMSLPFSCTPRQSDRPTADGYYPQRLSNLAKA